MTKHSSLKENKLPLMEAFYTIQGEGYHSGSPAYFLRIGGCDVGCHWCDVKESWDAEIHPMTSIYDILQGIRQFPVKTVVITGGEPLMWDLSLLTYELKRLNMSIHLETSGAYKLTGDFDWVCLSPKKNQPPLNSVKKIADELKIIVHNKHDITWAQNQLKNLKSKCKLYFQPEWSVKDKILPIIIDYVQFNQQWNISLQSHKYMNLP